MSEALAHRYLDLFRAGYLSGAGVQPSAIIGEQEFHREIGLRGTYATSGFHLTQVIGMTLNRQRRVLVTGLSSSLGLSVAQKFLEDGCFVIGTSRNPGLASRIYKGVLEPHAGFRFVACDLTVDADVDELASSIVTGEGTLDGLIHIAGGTRINGEFSEIPTNEWLKAYDLNVVSLQRLLNRLLPMLRVGQKPSIVLVGSRTAEEPGAWDPHYSAAKAGLMNLSKHLAAHLAPDGIRVNYLALGPTNSGEWATSSGETSTRVTDWSARFHLDGSEARQRSPISSAVSTPVSYG